MSEATKIPEVLDNTSERDTMRLLSSMKRMRDDHKYDDVYPHSVPDYTGPLPNHTPLPGYEVLQMQQYRAQLQQLRQLKEMDKNQERQDLKRPRLQIPTAREPGDSESWRRMQEHREAIAKDFDSDKTKDTPGSLYWENDGLAATPKFKKDTQKTIVTTETMDTETPATTAQKDREEVVGVLIRELWNDIRKSVAEVSKLKDDKIADQQLRIEQLEAEAENYRKKIKTLRAQREDMDRLEGKIESVCSQILYFKDQCKYLCECENCRDQDSEDEPQTD